MFKPAFFKSNRINLRSGFNDDSLFVFTASGMIQRSGSTTYPFKQDSNFWYLCGINEPDILMVINGSEEYLILPERSDSFEKFNGAIDVKKITDTSGITKAYSQKEGLRKLKRAVVNKKKVVTCLPLDDYIEAAGFYPNPARRRLVNTLTDIYPEIELVDARRQLARQRMVKQAPEIAAIEKAISISAAAFEKVKQNIASYKTEDDITVALTLEFIQKKAKGHAYDPIAASGKNACVLHYRTQTHPLNKSDLVLIDAGAEVDNYASDLTRTYALSAPTKRQVEVYQAVMDIRNYALGLLKPGQLFKEYEQSVKGFAAEAIKKLIPGSADISKYYPHSSSHFLGLDVHDAGDYDTALASGMVLTVEPGIYIEEEGIGIRIEDDILITAASHRNLSEQLSRELF